MRKRIFCAYCLADKSKNDRDAGGLSNDGWKQTSIASNYRAAERE
jgi:hypothetical protein